MPRETSLNDPLSGAEIKQIILAQIEAAMDKNCTLVDDLTYPGFSLFYELKIGFVRSPTKETVVWGESREGETGEVEAVTGRYAEDSPNKARLDHDLPQPVMVNTPDGQRRKKVRFEKPEAYAK